MHFWVYEDAVSACNCCQPHAVGCVLIFFGSMLGWFLYDGCFVSEDFCPSKCVHAEQKRKEIWKYKLKYVWLTTPSVPSEPFYISPHLQITACLPYWTLFYPCSVMQHVSLKRALGTDCTLTYTYTHSLPLPWYLRYETDWFCFTGTPDDWHRLDIKVAAIAFGRAVQCLSEVFEL